MRESGVLMHITSLPGPYGVGTMGKQAFSFVDFLAEAGQHCWQILPLNPTGFGDSPYQSCSAFAGNHYLIDLELLVEEGLIKREEPDAITWCRSEEKADFGLLYQNRLSILRKAFARLEDQSGLDAFCRSNESWLTDFAVFMALKDRFGGAPWYQWPEELKFRRETALRQACLELEYEIRFYCFVQYLFFRQWNALRAYAHEKGIRIIGDVPIYVPLDSVEVWKDPRLFQLDENLNPKVVAGCPPDAFTADGQLWGNPIYDWDAMAREDFAWWIRRLAAAGTLYDVVRLDHFRGLEAYWAIPYGDKTARNGCWVKGPGESFIHALQRQLPELSMIAEDLGYLTQEVLDLRNLSGYPGMKVLQFGFDAREPSEYLPHTYTRNSVCYTGTHDNLTMRQWFDTAENEAVDHAVRYMALSEAEGYVWGTIRTVMASVSDLAVVQMQDILDLGAAARMNFPGTLSDSNWTWRMKDGIITPGLSKKLRNITALYGRCDG